MIDERIAFSIRLFGCGLRCFAEGEHRAQADYAQSITKHFSDPHMFSPLLLFSAGYSPLPSGKFEQAERRYVLWLHFFVVNLSTGSARYSSPI